MAPSGRQVTYGLDAADRVTTVRNAVSGVNYASLNYTPSGTVSTTMTMGNSAVQTFSFNDRLQPTAIQVNGSGNSSLLALNLYPCPGQVTQCTSGNNGVVQSQTIAGGGLSVAQTYQYDKLNRITNASESGSPPAIESYSYESVTASPLALTNETPQSPAWYSTAVPNRIAGSQYAWSYDASGNVLQVGGTSRGFTYDAENRQAAANVNGVGAAYTYDGNGQRVTKTVSGYTTTYVYDAWGNLAAEYTGNPNEQASPCATATCYYALDHLGSTRLMMDATGSANVRRYDYLPFGLGMPAGLNGRTTSMGYGTAPDQDYVNPKYTGQMRDVETGLDYFNARYYSGAQGRFQSVDPGNAGADQNDPQTWNGYAYVGNGPLSITDPSGLFGEGLIAGAICGPVCEGIGIAVDVGVSLFDIFGSGGGGQTLSPDLVSGGDPVLAPIEDGGGGDLSPLNRNDPGQNQNSGACGNQCGGGLNPVGPSLPCGFGPCGAMGNPHCPNRGFRWMDRTLGHQYQFIRGAGL